MTTMTLTLTMNITTSILQAYLPHNIPWSAHGMFFPEAVFSGPATSGKANSDREEL